MDVIKHLLVSKVEEIKGAENEMAKLSYVMYDILKQFLEEILQSNWMGPNSKLAIVGGIMINSDGEGSDMFQPLMFEVRSKDGTKMDLYKETFDL